MPFGYEPFCEPRGRSAWAALSHPEGRRRAADLGGDGAGVLYGHGHIDSTGPESYNEGLALRRARAAGDHPSERGVDRERLRIAGFGERCPIATNGTAAGRALNRRVEIRRSENVDSTPEKC